MKNPGKYFALYGYSIFLNLAVLILLCITLSSFANGVDSNEEKKILIENNKIYPDYNYYNYDKNTQVYAQEEIEKKHKILVRKYNSKPFDYEEKELKHLSLWQRIQRKINDFLQSLLPENSIVDSEKFLNYSLLSIFIVTLLYLLYKIVFSTERTKVNRLKEKEKSKITFIEENILNVDIQAYLQESEINKNYTLSVRYLYLWTIQILANKGYLKWSPRKTNHEIYKEIKNEEIKNEFQDLLNVYHYVWFGDFQVHSHKYESIKEQFLNFHKKV